MPSTREHPKLLDSLRRCGPWFEGHRRCKARQELAIEEVRLSTLVDRLGEVRCGARVGEHDLGIHRSREFLGDGEMVVGRRFDDDADRPLLAEMLEKFASALRRVGELQGLCGSVYSEVKAVLPDVDSSVVHVELLVALG